MTLRLASCSAACASHQTPTVEGPEINGGENRSILIVDGSRLIRSVFRNTLSKNYDCVVAGCQDEALSLLAEFQFDIALVDVEMHGAAGSQLLGKIVTSYPRTTVVAVSGADRRELAINSLGSGAFDYLIKPCDLTELESAVERAFEQRSLTRRSKMYHKGADARIARMDLTQSIESIMRILDLTRVLQGQAGNLHMTWKCGNELVEVTIGRATDTAWPENTTVIDFQAAV